MPNSVQSFARKAADRVDPQEVGFDPITIVTILVTMLPMLVDCFKRFDTADPESMKAEIARQNERNPKQLLRRMTAGIKRSSDTKITRSEAAELARATIEEILETEQQTIVQCCAEMEEV